MLGDQALHDAGRQQRLAVGDHLDRLDEAIDRRRLEHEPGRPRAQRLVERDRVALQLEVGQAGRLLVGAHGPPS